MATRQDLDLDAFATLLRERHEGLGGRLSRLSAAPERGGGISFGKRIGDGTIEAVSRLTDIGVGRSLEIQFDEVEHALEKLADGTYGICDSCGAPIPERRLHARPESALCVPCAGRQPRR